ncbi:MAG: hypothetical protein K2H61_04755 [Muribaculaceae bacterium]|nr:hypothetical protein [Muribaculaceae bacterium]
MKKLLIYLLFAPIFACTTSCGSSPTKAGNSEAQPLVRLDSIVATFGQLSENQQDSIISVYGGPLSDYLFMMGLTSADLRGSIDTLSHSAAFSVFLPDIAQRFNASDSLAMQLAQLETNISQKLPQLTAAEYFAITSPYRQSVMLVDSTVFIALNHYLGADYDGYRSMPDYAKVEKQWRRIPYDVLRARLAVAYDLRDNYADLSQQLLHDGAVDYTMMQLVPDANIGDMLGWTPEQVDLVERSERQIWETMVMRNLIYSTDPVDRARLFDASPATSIISPQLPGQVGRYMGLKLIEAYVKSHPDVSLNQLLSPEFAYDRNSFLSAGYSPQ